MSGCVWHDLEHLSLQGPAPAKYRSYMLQHHSLWDIIQRHTTRVTSALSKPTRDLNTVNPLKHELIFFGMEDLEK